MARLAEEAGFESLWVGEHVVLPEPRVAPSPMEPGDPILEPLVSLAFLAGQTERLLLGTGIVILPQRNPVVLAKAVASLDVLSGGRLLFGIGAGYLEPEMTAIGVSIHERGGRTDEYLAAMRSLWYEPQPRFEGRFARFEGVQAHPRPTHRVPIIVGGHTPAAFRRTVEQGDGWYGFGLDLDGTARHLEGLRAAAARYERPAELGPVEVTITPAATPDRAEARRFAELGVDRLVVQPGRELDEEGLVAFVSQVGESLGG